MGNSAATTTQTASQRRRICVLIVERFKVCCLLFSLSSQQTLDVFVGPLSSYICCWLYYYLLDTANDLQTHLWAYEFHFFFIWMQMSSYLTFKMYLWALNIWGRSSIRLLTRQRSQMNLRSTMFWKYFLVFPKTFLIKFFKKVSREKKILFLNCFANSAADIASKQWTLTSIKWGLAHFHLKQDLIITKKSKGWNVNRI